jgi:serine/threonine protein kinase/tetratricopeptide (TPR) repeat protein
VYRADRQNPSADQPENTMHVLTEGTLLAGRYVLVRRLGVGGMGEIWLADDRRSDSRVALKFVADVADASAVEALQKEWRIGSRLMHANIVRVFEFHDDPDGAFYAMQYVGGPDISVLTGITLDEILRPIALLADALRYAHAKNLIHRDIKASNVLLDARGMPYLVDFGVAAMVGQSRATGGSAINASPQQQANEPPATADDIYALGVLVVELVTGQPPEGCDTDSLRKLLDGNGDPLPGALVALLGDMLNEDAASRPAAEAVTERLSEAGFAPGAAPKRLLGASGDDSANLSVESIQPFERRSYTAPAETPAQGKESGVSPKVLYSGLVVMLVVFLGVIFLLPPAVDKTSQRQQTEETEAGDTQLDPGAEGTPSSRDTPAVKESSKDKAGFSENAPDVGTDNAALTKAATDEALGDLLSRLERLRFRAIDRWGGQPYLDMLDIYAKGDQAYVDRDYALAGQHYRKALELLDPFFDQADREFDKALSAARESFDNGDHVNAVRSYDLAVAITPGNAEAAAGLARALNLKSVLDLMDQALQFESDLELEAARIAFEKVLDLDAAWEPAITGLARIRATIKQFSFDQRMTEGFDALSAGDFATARAAFNAAKALDPASRQPADGLLQVDQEVRLASISQLQRRAKILEQNEEWETATSVYQQVLEIDGDLQFAKDGLAYTRQREKLHNTLNEYINDPDALSAPATMRAATRLLLDLTRISPMGPRLADQKSTLTRLLKRAATPLGVQLISDGLTEVAIFKVAKLGKFEVRELSLRPGVYVAVGSRPGYRDVRIEFRVAPEIEMKPIVVQCEEQI